MRYLKKLTCKQGLTFLGFGFFLMAFFLTAAALLGAAALLRAAALLGAAALLEAGETWPFKVQVVRLWPSSLQIEQAMVETVERVSLKNWIFNLKYRKNS